MFRYFLIGLNCCLGLVSCSAVTFASCPDPLPDRPSSAILRDCFNEVSDLRKKIEELGKSITQVKGKQDDLQRQIDRLQAGISFTSTTAKSARRPATTNIFEGRCSTEAPKIVSGACISQDGNAALQNFGPESDPDGVGKWVCVWGRAMAAADVTAYCTK
jgi:hypothetical protein